MPEASWINLAIQIPIVVLFAYVMLRMQDRFLKHLDDNEMRSKTFIKEQREENNQALRDLTERMCEQFDQMDKRLDMLTVLDVSHDAFVRASFGERFGPATMARAEQASKDAEAKYLKEQSGS
jgi:hypothetical protein